MFYLLLRWPFKTHQGMKFGLIFLQCYKYEVEIPLIIKMMYQLKASTTTKITPLCTATVAVKKRSNSGGEENDC